MEASSSEIVDRFAAVFERAARAGLHIEGDEILYSEDQGTPASQALVCVDRWLGVREGAIRLQVRVLARNSVEDGWECVSEGQFSDPLTTDQASSLVEHWCDLQRDAAQRYYVRQVEEQERVDAFGPRLTPDRPRF